jgi:16S rRNA (cytidine1402-2'-O)-methyltransferase
VVSTPIGNLQDISFRALQVLKSSDLIAAEGVSHSKRLCTHYGIKTVLTSYNQHNQRVKGPEILARLEAGHDVALITNAGTPGISDPGSMLIREAHERRIRVCPVPGPSAVTAALSVSGLKVDRFVFLGFLPSKEGKRRKEIETLAEETRALVLFEAPHRIRATLRDIRDILGDRKAVLLKEMTKLHETVEGGTVTELIQGLGTEAVRGEYTLVLAGKEEEKADIPLGGEIRERIERLLREENMGVKEIATKLARHEDMPYRGLYKACLGIRKSLKPPGPLLKNGVDKDTENH